MTMSVIDEIAAERKRQIEQEGWTTEHDDRHDRGEMAKAAACYAVCRRIVEAERGSPGPNFIKRDFWPWSLEWWKPKDRRRDLIRAAALIVAEIERLDREKKS